MSSTEREPKVGDGVEAFHSGEWHQGRIFGFHEYFTAERYVFIQFDYDGVTDPRDFVLTGAFALAEEGVRWRFID